MKPTDVPALPCPICHRPDMTLTHDDGDPCCAECREVLVLRAVVEVTMLRATLEVSLCSLLTSMSNAHTLYL